MSIPELILDGWADTLKGLGTLAGSTVTSVFGGPGQATLNAYAALYNGDWLARRIVDIFPAEALRKRPDLQDLDEDQVTALWAKYDRLNTHELYPSGVLAHALSQGRALGGAVVLLGFQTGKPDKSAPEPGPQSKLAWLDVCPWEHLGVVSRVTDANSPRFGLPEILRVNGPHVRAGLEIHASRTLTCAGLAKATQEQGDLTPWLSVLQPVEEVLKRYGLSWEAASMLLQEASVGVLKMKGLTGLIARKDEAAVEARMKLMSQGRSVAKTVFLDAEFDESFSRTDVSFAGLSSVLELLEMQVAGAANVPVTRLFKRSPDGQNATGESDMRIFYDDVASYRRANVEPIQEALLGYIAGKPVAADYPPLWEISETERSEIRKVNAETDRMYWDLNVLESSDIIRSRTADGSLGVDLEDPEARAAAADDAPDRAVRPATDDQDDEEPNEETDQTDQEV